MKMPNGSHAKFLFRHTDNTGKVRVYFRHAATGKVWIKHEIGTPEFEATYADLVDKAKRYVASFDDLPAPENGYLPRFLFRDICAKAKARADKRGQTFNLTPEFLIGLYERQRQVCAVTGIRLLLPRTRGDRHRNPFSISLDRIDSRLGYTTENVRLVCLITNLAMSTWGEGPLGMVAKAMNENSKQRKKP